MKRLHVIAASAMLMGVGTFGALTATAAHPAGDTCMDIQWSAELLKMYPRAPAACQEVAVRHGKKYARFTGKVTAVAPDVVTVRFLNVAGDPGREIQLKPGQDAKVEMAGKKVEYSKLQKDDVLTFWVPEQQVGVISDPDDKAASTIILK
jgi:hypothetical protein